MRQTNTDTTSYGAKGHFVFGGGMTSVTCTVSTPDECGAKQTLRYAKICFGGAIGAGFGTGVVGNMNGKSCRSGTYVALPQDKCYPPESLPHPKCYRRLRV